MTDTIDEIEAEAEPETEPETVNPVLAARIVIRELLDDVQAGISRTRAPGMARCEAATHLATAAAYLGTTHPWLAAVHAAWGLAFLDVAASKRMKLPAALAARWVQVRDALPEKMRENMPDRAVRAR